MVPPVGIVMVEVTDGVPVAEIATGTFIDAVVEQVLVVKLKVVDHGPVPHPVTALTLQ